MLTDRIMRRSRNKTKARSGKNKRRYDQRKYHIAKLDNLLKDRPKVPDLDVKKKGRHLKRDMLKYHLAVKEIRAIRRLRSREKNYYRDRDGIDNHKIQDRVIRRLEVCMKRMGRRGVLFAFNKVGRGKGGPKKRRLTADSAIKC